MCLVLDASVGSAAAFKFATFSAAFWRPVEPMLRRVRTRDGDAMQRFVMGLCAASRRMRFHGAINACTPGMLRQLTQVGGAAHVALVAVLDGEGGEEIVGEARCFVAGASAEFAIAVADSHQGRGLADRMFRALLQAASAAGVATLYGDVLDGNARMVGFLHRHGFAIDLFCAVDAGITRWQRAISQGRA